MWIWSGSPENRDKGFMLSPFHIRASKFTFDNNEQMAFMKSAPENVLPGRHQTTSEASACPACWTGGQTGSWWASRAPPTTTGAALLSSLSPLPAYAGSLAPLKSNVALRVKDIYWIVLGSCVNWLETESRSWKSFWWHCCCCSHLVVSDGCRGRVRLVLCSRQLSTTGSILSRSRSSSTTASYLPPAARKAIGFNYWWPGGVTRLWIPIIFDTVKQEGVN